MIISSRAARSARRLSLAVIAGAVALTGAAPAAQAELRVTKNYRISSDSSPFRGSDQPALAVNPNNPQHIVATNVNFLEEHCEATASFDGGATWSPAFDLKPPNDNPLAPFLPSCRVSNHSGESMYHAVAFGSGQTVYATSITPRAPNGVEQGATALVYKSTNGGVTWSEGVVALPGGTGNTAATGPYYELPSVLVDAGAGPGGQDIVYSIARDFSGSGNSGPPCTTNCDPVRVARSLDGGQTFGTPVQASTPGVDVVDAASPVLGPDGSIGITWRTRGAAAQIEFVRSTDQGQSWSAPVVVTNVTNIARAGNSHVTPAPSSASSFPRMAVDANNGNLYIVYNQGPPGPTPPAGGYQGADHFIPPDSHVYFQRSLDDGATWSTPKLVNDNTIHPGTRIVQTRHPHVGVAPNGRVDIVWEDRRHWYMAPQPRTWCVHTHIACDDARLGDAYYAYSTNAGASFTERRLSDHSHNNDVGYDYRFATYWAFGPVSVALGANNLLVGWMDSREGNFDNDNQDIYLAKVDHDAGGPDPQENIGHEGPVARSVTLSKRAYPGGGESVLTSTFATRAATSVVIVNQDDVA
ncbi:MAG TPA: sialidase family protein, partial [Solirubrobacteraceae bacterium]|nr:sialidase family protein [Solirubrobacteraceae bacterium]